MIAKRPFAWLFLAAAFPAVLPACAAQTPASAQYNPLRAEKDVEVGKFYLRKGDPDAAISRFLDAIQYKPNYAEPRVLLGRAYEKKSDKADAIRYYKEYLKILPEARDAKKIRERIAKLSRELPGKSASPHQAKSAKNSTAWR